MLVVCGTSGVEDMCFKVGSYNTYVWYWRVLTPQVITFDPEGVRP